MRRRSVAKDEGFPWLAKFLLLSGRAGRYTALLSERKDSK